MTQDSQTITADRKPCPFCGKSEHLKVFPAHENQTAVPSFAVRCCFYGVNTGCGAETGYGAATEEIAWKVWNKRAEPAGEILLQRKDLSRAEAALHLMADWVSGFDFPRSQLKALRDAANRLTAALNQGQGND